VAAERRQVEVAAILSDGKNASDYETLGTASAEATALADEIATLYHEWESLTEALGTTAG
jgi:hypothetical protein